MGWMAFLPVSSKEKSTDLFRLNLKEVPMAICKLFVVYAVFVFTAMGLSSQSLAAKEEGKVARLPDQDLFEAPWRTMGTTFESYQTFKMSALFKIKAAKKRVLVFSSYFADVDIASALYSAHLRKVVIKVVLDERGLRRYASRHRYFMRTQMPIFLTKLGRLSLEAPTTILIDDKLWRVSVPLSPRVKTQIGVMKSPRTTEEVLAWFQAERFSKLTPTLAHKFGGANSFTTRVGKGPSSGIVSGVTGQKRPPGVPKRLPKETRMQKLQRGINIPDPIAVDNPGLKALVDDGSQETDYEIDLIPKREKNSNSNKAGQ